MNPAPVGQVPIAVKVLGGIPSIPPSPLVSFLSPSLHPPKLRLRVASILQVDIQTKVRKIPCCVVDNSGCAGSLLFGLFLDARSWDPVALPLLSTVARWRSDFLGSFGSSPGLVGKSLSVGFVAGSVSGRAGGR